MPICNNDSNYILSDVAAVRFIWYIKLCYVIMYKNS